MGRFVYGFRRNLPNFERFPFLDFFSSYFGGYLVPFVITFRLGGIECLTRVGGGNEAPSVKFIFLPIFCVRWQRSVKSNFHCF